MNVWMDAFLAPWQSSVQRGFFPEDELICSAGGSINHKHFFAGMVIMNSCSTLAFVAAEIKQRRDQTWKKVFFIDESKFELFGNNQRQFV